MDIWQNCLCEVAEWEHSNQSQCNPRHTSRMLTLYHQYIPSSSTISFRLGLGKQDDPVDLGSSRRSTRISGFGNLRRRGWNPQLQFFPEKGNKNCFCQWDRRVRRRGAQGRRETLFQARFVQILMEMYERGR